MNSWKSLSARSKPPAKSAISGMTLPTKDRKFHKHSMIESSLISILEDRKVPLLSRAARLTTLVRQEATRGSMSSPQCLLASKRICASTEKRSLVGIARESVPMIAVLTFCPGPVVVIASFASEEEAVNAANNTTYGLGSAVFTNDLKRAHRVAAEIEAGMVWINSTQDCDPRIPFGGMYSSPCCSRVPLTLHRREIEWHRERVGPGRA